MMPFPDTTPLELHLPHPMFAVAFLTWLRVMSEPLRPLVQCSIHADNPPGPFQCLLDGFPFEDDNSASHVSASLRLTRCRLIEPSATSVMELAGQQPSSRAAITRSIPCGVPKTMSGHFLSGIGDTARIRERRVTSVTQIVELRSVHSSVPRKSTRRPPQRIPAHTQTLSRGQEGWMASARFRSRSTSPSLRAVPPQDATQSLRRGEVNRRVPLPWLTHFQGQPSSVVVASSCRPSSRATFSLSNADHSNQDRVLWLRYEHLYRFPKILLFDSRANGDTSGLSHK